MTIASRSVLVAAGTMMLAMSLAGGAGAQMVGKVGAVNPASSSVPPGEAARTVQLGAPVIYRERITTSDTGSLQLAFLDKSTLSVSPNSDLIVDEYVYDPDAGQGRAVMSLARGAMRFVGGQISHGGGTQVRTPVATIGIRGGAGTITHDERGTRVVSSFGIFTIETPNGTTEIRRPGFIVTIADAAIGPSSPRRVTQADLASDNARLTSAPGQDGSAPIRPSDEGARGAIGFETARTDPAKIIPLSSNTAEVSRPLPLLPGDRVGPNPTATPGPIVESVRESIVTDTAKGAVSPEPGGPGTVAPGAFALSMTNGAGGRMPYVSGAISGTSGGVVVSPVLGYRNGGTGDDGGRAVAMQAGLSISGQGGSQHTSLLVATGDFYRRPGGGYEVSGGFNASARVNATSEESFAFGFISSVPGTIQTDPRGLPVRFDVNQDGIDPVTGTIYRETAFEYGGGVPAREYEYRQTATPTLAPSGLGAHRPRQTLGGYAAGLMSTSSYGGTISGPVRETYAAISSAGGTGVTIGLDPTTSRARGTIAMVGTAQDAAGFLGAVYEFGGESIVPGRSAYVDRNNFAMLEDVVPASGGGYETTSSVITHAGAERYSYSGLALVTWDTIAQTNPTMARNFLGGVQACACEYLEWGGWSVDADRDVGTGYAVERGALMFWVAGELSSPSAIPNVGTATYNGHAVANIENSSGSTTRSYSAAGTYRQTVDFQHRTGTVAINNLDGRNYTGTIGFASANPVHFAGSVTNAPVGGSATLPISGAVMGSFYGPATGGVGPREVGGQFLLQGTNYKGAGIFAAKR